MKKHVHWVENFRSSDYSRETGRKHASILKQQLMHCPKVDQHFLGMGFLSILYLVKDSNSPCKGAITFFTSLLEVTQCHMLFNLILRFLEIHNNIPGIFYFIYIYF